MDQLSASLATSFLEILQSIKHHLIEAIAILLFVELVIHLVDHVTKDNLVLHGLWLVLKAAGLACLVLIIFDAITGLLQRTLQALQTLSP